VFKNLSEIEFVIIAGTIVLVLLAVFIISFLFFYQYRQNKHLNEKQLMKTQFQQELLQTQLEIQEQTLKTISEEIHDNVGQVLSLAKLNLNTVVNINDEQAQLKIDSTKNLVSKAINDLRNLSRSLHGERIGEIGLQEAIANELRIVQNTGQFKTDLKITGQPYKLDPQKEMVLFRIVQEALHNAVKHSNATHLKVSANYNAEHFTLTISDDGNGFQPEQLPAAQTGIGLKSMQNRAALIGAAFSLQSSKNNGTSISIQLPTTKL
jgi:signal transduction histidine kinase